jgi:ribonuclease P/MRP protein subunit POP7
MAAVKRARKQLDEQARRRAAEPAQKNASLHARVEALKRGVTGDNGSGSGDRNGGEGVVSSDGAVVKVMGTGKAVEKTLKVASFFEQQADCAVEIRTGTVGAVDDVVMGEGKGEHDEGDGQTQEDGQTTQEDRSRVRRVSSLEVSIRLR